METTTHRRHAGTAAAPPSLAFALPILAILAFFSPAPSASADAAAAPDPGPAGASQASHPVYSYDEGTSIGPDKWAILDKDWATCHNGTKQSPIDIAKVEAHKDMGPLKQTYKAATGVVQNRGHDFILKWKDGNGNLTVQGKEYTLRQVHWHVPAEHTVNGTSRFDMEMHMVHEDSSNARAVVSVLFSTKGGHHPSKTLSHLEPYFKRLADKENEEEEVKEPVDPAVWVDEASGYYRYEGSLTTPPCAEGVIWTIMSTVKHASEEQIELLHAVTKTKEHNDRPVQKINGRVVRYYEGPQTKGGGKSLVQKIVEL